MKIILIACLFAAKAFALDYEAIIATHEKYCELNVKAACDAFYCKNKSGKCVVAVEHQPEGEKRAMESLVKKCGNDKACLLKETEGSKQIALEGLKVECAKGKIEACYQQELLKSM